MKKHFIWMLLLATFLVLAACGSLTDDTNEPETEKEEEPTVEDNEKDGDNSNEIDPENEEGQADDDAEATEQENDVSDDEGLERMTETGIYNGQADVHTIEIETEDGPTAFQLTIEARDDVENLTVGEDVTYTYYEDGEQLVIESVEPA